MVTYPDQPIIPNIDANTERINDVNKDNTNSDRNDDDSSSDGDTNDEGIDEDFSELTYLWPQGDDEDNLDNEIEMNTSVNLANLDNFLIVSDNPHLANESDDVVSHMIIYQQQI